MIALIVKNTKLVGTTTVASKFFIASFKYLKQGKFVSFFKTQTYRMYKGKRERKRFLKRDLRFQVKCIW